MEKVWFLVLRLVRHTMEAYALEVQIPYARHYNPLLIRNRSWILTLHKARILRKKILEKTFLDFKKWVKSIQTAGYNGARTVINFQENDCSHQS